MDSPDVLQNPATAIGQQFLANGGQPTPSDSNAPVASPAPQGGQPAPQLQNPQGGQGQPAAPTPDPTTAKHTAIGRFFQNIAGGGSGSSASQLWRSIIGGALVGMGAAENAPVVARGPYGDVRDRSPVGAASRGFQAGMGNAQAQQDRQRAIAQQNEEKQRRDQQMQIEVDDAKLRQAADARAQQASIQNSVEHEKRMQMLDQSIATGNYDAAQRTAKSAQDQVAFFNALQEVGAQPLPDADGKALQFSTHADAEKAAHDNPQFFIGDFKTRTAYDPSTGKYGIYRVPDTDIKNVQLKDQQGNLHTIPRMSASDYLDYQARQQNLQKGALSIEEAKARLAAMGDEKKASNAYGKALEELDKVGGDADKLSPSSRSVLYNTAAKNLDGALRAHTAAVKAEDQDAAEASLDAIKHYSGVLSQLHGKQPGATSGGGLTPAQYSQALTHALTLPPDQAIKEIQGAQSLSDADKQRLISDLQKQTGQTSDQKRANAQAVATDNEQFTGPNPANF